MDRLVRKDFMAGENIRSAGEGFTAASAAYLNHKLHGHGFAARYFQGFASSLYLKCYRCPGCHLVITLRPDSHFSRIQSSKEEIRSHLAHRLNEGLWPRSSLPRTSLRRWLANLTRQTLARLGKDWGAGLLAAFDHLLAAGMTPVSRVI